MFVQIKNGRIVRLSESKNDGDIELELPEDFDFERFDRYKVINGALIKHDILEEEKPSLQDRVENLEEALEMILSGVTE